MVLKKYKEGDPFPEDFWNYNICPITGWVIKKKPITKKYMLNDSRQKTD